MQLGNWPSEICTSAGIDMSNPSLCGNYWTAWSAIATAAAAIVAAVIAVIIPLIMVRREWAKRDLERSEEWDRRDKDRNHEWARQDTIRTRENAERQAERVATIREICSAANQITAYRDVAVAIAKTRPPFHGPMLSLERIGSNAKTLHGMLDILKTRPDLTDGATYAAVAAQRIAAVVVEQTCPPYGQTPNDWPDRVAALDAVALDAGLVEKRVAMVRQKASLGASKSAAEIRDKYEPMCVEIAAALAAQRAPIFGPLENDHY